METITTNTMGANDEMDTTTDNGVVVNKRTRAGITVEEQQQEQGQMADKAWIRDMFTLQNQKLDDILDRLSAKQEEHAQQLQQHSTVLTDHDIKINNLIALQADSKWQRTKAVNVKFTIDPASPLTQFLLPRNCSEDVKQQVLKSFCDWVSTNTAVAPMPSGHKVVFPRNPQYQPFFIIRFASEVLADQARSHFALFTQNKVYTGNDLTLLEQARKREILAIMKATFPNVKFPQGRFVRDCIKVCIDNNDRMVVANLEQVKEYIAHNRLKPYTPKNVQGGQS